MSDDELEGAGAVPPDEPDSGGDSSALVPAPSIHEVTEKTERGWLAQREHEYLACLEWPEGHKRFEAHVLGTIKARSYRLRDRLLVARYLFAVSMGAKQGHAAAYAGVRRETVRDWMRLAEETPPGEVNEFVEFRNLVNAILAQRPIKNLLQLNKSAANGSVLAQKTLLEIDGYRDAKAERDKGFEGLAKTAETTLRSWAEIVADHDNAERTGHPAPDGGGDPEPDDGDAPE